MNAVLNTLAPHDGRSDFNFVFGSWIVHNRRLLKALQGRDEWETFEATSVARPLLGGIGWSGVDTTTPRWEQAFSADGGKTWEINWIMDHERIEGAR